MNIFRNLAGANGATISADTTELETDGSAKQSRLERKRLGLDSGPHKVRTISTGQIRRAQIRSEAAEQRKGYAGYRRRWLARQDVLSRVAGQVHVVRNLADGHPLRENAIKGLRKRFATDETTMVTILSDGKRLVDYDDDAILDLAVAALNAASKASKASA